MLCWYWSKRNIVRALTGLSWHQSRKLSPINLCSALTTLISTTLCRHSPSIAEPLRLHPRASFASSPYPFDLLAVIAV